MKKRSLIFILTLAIFTLVSCQEEPDEPLSGTWDIRWENEYGTLHGDIHFAGKQAILKAYGEGHSPFLKEYEEKQFGWQFRAGELVLYPEENSLGLHYNLRKQAAGYLEFDHLDGIKVILKKKHP